MTRPPPRSTRTYTLFPSTTLFRSPVDDARTLTYSELKDEVCKAANALTELGLVSGDRVAIYMPMVPEAIVSMLACARLGIMNSVVFAGYRSEEHTSELQSLMRISYAVFCLKKKNNTNQ